MLDSWIDEVHESASWLCIFFLSPLLSLGSSDRSHNVKILFFSAANQDVRGEVVDFFIQSKGPPKIERKRKRKREKKRRRGAPLGSYLAF